MILVSRKRFRGLYKRRSSLWSARPQQEDDREKIVVEHRQGGRIVARHSLAHLCWCCGEVYKPEEKARAE